VKQEKESSSFRAGRRSRVEEPSEIGLGSQVGQLSPIGETADQAASPALHARNVAALCLETRKRKTKEAFFRV